LFCILINKKVATNYKPLSPNYQKEKGRKSLGDRRQQTPIIPLGEFQELHAILKHQVV
jgi:hypothetical protein